MQKNKKIFLIICVIVGILLVGFGVLLLLDNDSKENPKKPNEEKPNVEEKPGDDSDEEEEPGEVFSSTEVRKVDGIEISNVKYVKRDVDYALSFDVVNNSGKDYSNLNIAFKLYEGAHFFLYSFDFNLGQLKKGEKKSFEYTFSFDFTMMNDFDFVITK